MSGNFSCFVSSLDVFKYKLIICHSIIISLFIYNFAYQVPRVFIGGKFVGGGDDVVALHSNGKLKTILEEAGAI